MNKQYIKLPRISNQKIRQKYYTPESIAHPAKANIPMMIWILKKFVQDGDIVLDPMAGIFTTGVEGMRLFPNSLFIGVELEDKFVKMARANIKKVEKIVKKDMFMKIGKAVCVQGDTRELEKILKEKVSKIITSPPFQQAGTDTEKKMKKRLDKVFKGRSYVPTQKYQGSHNISNIKPYGSVNKIISSPPFGQAQSGGGIAKKGYDGPKHTPTDMVGKRSYMPENIGDKNNISNLPYGQADKIISSPPYAETRPQSSQEPQEAYRPELKALIKSSKQTDPNNIGNLKYGQTDKIIFSPPFGGKVQHKTNYLGRQKQESGFEYSDNPENIGNMPHGQIDKVITSPPYSEIRMDGGGKDRAGMKPYTDETADTWRTQRDQKNIGNLPHGKIDKVITSPPYAQTISPKSGGPTAEKFNAGGCRKLRSYSSNEENIGNKEYGKIDKVISSPPYEEGIGHGGKRRTKVLSRNEGIWAQGRDSYSKSKSNIGSLTGKTYLGEMLKVYRECLKILKPGGLMILILKDFIRGGKRIPLGEDTIKLCQAAGFEYLKTYYRKIEHPSFWRVLQIQKYGETYRIDSEDILVFRK